MDVAIIGGGVAGLATAIFLKQLGMHVAVYERRHSVHNLGAGVVCWPNATFVLDQLELLDELSSVAACVTSMRRISKDGTELGNLNIETIDAAMGFPSLGILREDLMRILLRRAKREGIPIHYNTQVVSIERHADTCHLRLANGKSLFPDFIVGADGRMSSVARKCVLGDNRPVYQGFTNWIGIHRFRRPALERMEIRDYWGVGARFGIVPVSDHTAYWAGGIASREDFRGNNGENMTQLKEVFASWPAPISEIVAHASESTTKYLGLYDHESVSTWHKHNVVIIGDAAHAALPTSGQGVAQALEDAWWLARELAATPTNLDTAMEGFTKRRLSKTTGIMQTGRHLAKMLFSEDAAACELRDQAAQQTDYTKLAQDMASGWSAGLPLSL